MTPAWRTCEGTWCRFASVVLPDPPAAGILLVWSGQRERRCVYLAQGGIATNLKWARQFPPILEHGDLFVTWATVPEDHQSGIRNYLIARLSPLFCDRASDDPPIPVELPWNQEPGVRGAVG
ncbi:MAG: hypothetical protein JO359_10635 [Candidatus Eremiobacteraeota bacterium]|nr:hypothetical protein [Candidatus Eremiobacteraeota bacterium]